VKGSGRGASGGEEAAWRDLIANYAAGPQPDGGDTPWPERENLPVPPRAGLLPEAGPETDPSLALDLSDDTDPALDLGPDPGGNSGPGPAHGPVARPAPGHRDDPMELVYFHKSPRHASATVASNRAHLSDVTALLLQLERIQEPKL